MSDFLFNGGDLAVYLREKHDEHDREMVGWGRDYTLDMPEKQLCGYLVEKYRMEPVRLDAEGKTVDEEPVGSQDHLIVISVPFDGDAAIFRYKPSASSASRVPGRIDGNQVRLDFRIAFNSPDLTNEAITRHINEIRRNLMLANKQVEEYNNYLPERVRAPILERKALYSRQIQRVEHLGIPIRRRENAAATYKIPNVVRKARIERPAAPDRLTQPDPTLAMEEYEHILNVAQNMALVLERSPSAFKAMGEEDIRTHFLVQLNGQYEGQATGETFNQYGKTDILLRYNGENAFIAECKFWVGPKAFAGIIDQLLGYISWRDTKTAIFLFNRNQNMSRVLEQIPALVKEHSNYKRGQPGPLDATRFRYIFHQRNDIDREFYLTICVFDVPSAD